MAGSYTERLLYNNYPLRHYRSLVEDNSLPSYRTATEGVRRRRPSKQFPLEADVAMQRQLCLQH